MHRKVKKLKARKQKKLLTKNKGYTLPLIVGLGNPGTKYTETRHNAGFLVLDETAAFFHVNMKKRCFRPYERGKTGNGSVLLKPLTFMNLSGKAVHDYVPRRFGADELIVICDTLDLPPGMIRVKKGGSSAGHNGLKSIISSIGSSDFIRIYVGVGRPASAPIVEHVLSVFEDPEQRDLFFQGVDKAKQAVINLIGGRSVTETAGVYNRKNSP